MKRSRRKQLVGAALLVTFGYGAQALATGPLPAPKAPLEAAAIAGISGWRPSLGDARVYRVSSRGTSRVDFALMASGVSRSIGQAVAQAREAEQIQTIRYDISAQLHTRVIGVDARGFVVSARLQDVGYRVDEVTDARQDLLSAPFVIRYHRTGQIASFSFPPKFPTELRRAIQRLVEPLEIVAGDPGAASWSAQEQESDIDYSARYQLSGIDRAAGRYTVNKTKTQATPRTLAEANLPLSGRPTTKIDRSDAVAEFDLAGHGLVKLTLTEKLSTYWGKAFFSDYDYTFEATRENGPLANLPRTLAEAEAKLADLAFARARLYDVDAQSLNAVRGLTLPMAVSTYRTQIIKNTGLGSRQLRSWLRVNPAKSLELTTQLDAIDPKLDEKAFEFGWAALASAGHPEAQNALLAVVTQPGWKPLSKEKALIAMMSLEMPEPTLARAVWNQSTALAQTPGLMLQRSIATNVYGTMGDVEKANPALTDEVVKNLAGLLAKPDADSKVLALDALSNVGDLARVAPLAAPHLEAQDPAVRVSAFSTFRRMPGEAAFERFAAAFAKEQVPEVRLQAAKVASQMARSEKKNEWAKAKVSKETDLRVQSELVRIIGADLEKHPENTEVLRGLLTTVHDRQVRRDIYAFVSPAAQGGAR